ncbi:MAG: phosphoglyceromutase [Propionibacteriaceae bacterium]|jgi:2,3-bisphosphoglycerate-dependent phosphoglycerate mutase|nr:phosphoglyceromutase [Propionibacteriaceae bacterium]
MTAKLILLRHGESEWNSKNLFTGWVDVGLNDKGQAEALAAAGLLKDANLLPDKLFTSLLRRAITTANIALDASDRHWIPVERSWRLNERHYGALQGLNKSDIRETYGEEQFMIWRRSYDVPPPEIELDSQFSQFNDSKYATLPPELRPRTECLKDVLGRVLPFWYDRIIPDLRSGATVLVAAHGNSLRSLVKHLDNISDEAITELNIPTGVPLFYELGDDMTPIAPGRYLDPEAAKASIEAVKNQGREVGLSAG